MDESIRGWMVEIGTGPILAGAAFVLTGAFMGLTRLSHDLRLPAAVLILAYFVLCGLAVLAVWHWSSADQHRGQRGGGNEPEDPQPNQSIASTSIIDVIQGRRCHRPLTLPS